MKKILFIVTLIFSSLSISSLSAQEYNTAVGLSLGGNTGVNVKQMISTRSAIEGGIDYTFKKNTLNFFAVWQYHFPLADQFYAYGGGGVNLGAQNLGDGDNNGKFVFGLDPNVGVEYKLPENPITVGFDYRPSLNLVGSSLWSNASLKLRYTF